MKTYRYMPLLGIASLLIIWYIVFYLQVIDTAFFDPPHVIIITLYKLLGNQTTWLNIYATLLRTITGFLFSAIIGIPLGLLLGYFISLKRTFEPLLDFLRSIPVTALLPLFIILFGVGDYSKVALVIYASALIIAVYTMLGVTNCSKTRKTYAKSLGLSSIKIFRKIIFFESMPSTLIGLRASISLALVLVIVAEMLMMGGVEGLGGQIYNSRYSAQYSAMYALILLCGLLGYILNISLYIISKKLVHWNIDQ